MTPILDHHESLAERDKREHYEEMRKFLGTLTPVLMLFMLNLWERFV